MVTFKGTTIKLLLIFCLITILPILININTAKAEVHTTKIYASKDKFVDNSGGYDYWGSSAGKTLYVGQFFVPNFGYTQSVLGFSIPTLPDNVKSIKLYMNGYSADSCRITVYGSEDDSWSETSTAIPSKDVETTSNIGVGTGWSNSIDITSFILDQYNGDKYASLVLSPTNTASHNTFAFYASEHSGACPFLLVTYTIPSLDAQPNHDITEDNINNMDINITLEDDTFASSTLNTSMFALDGKAAANGLTVDSVTYVDSTHATLKLSHDGRDIDDHFQFQVAIDGSQLSSASTLQSNDISVHAIDEIDVGGTYNLDDIGPHPDIIISTTDKVTLTQTSHGALSNVIVTYTVSGADLEIDSVNIDNTSFVSKHTIGFMGTSNTLTVSGNNTIKSYNDLYHAGSPAILVGSSTEVTIDGAGSLNAYGGNNSAAIGSDENQQYGTININSGTITATGGRYGAGIGGGYRSLGGGTINISGGMFSIKGGEMAAGIGGGNEGSVGTINISGGTITTTGGWISSGIGGGFKSSGGIVNISGGLVYADHTNIDADDIGNGRYGGGCQVSITGSSVVFLRTGNVASHPNNNISHPYYNSETIVSNKAYGYPVPSSWNGTAYAYITDIVFVSGVSFTPESHTLVLGDADISNDTVTLIPTISPSYATDKTVSYVSSDTSVATVDSSGVVTAIKAGTAIITATANDDKGVSGTCTINVTQKVTGVSLAPASTTLILGDVDVSNNTVALTPTILPSNATDKSVSYTSSNASVATVDSLGVVTAVKAGTATITATSNDGNNATGTCDITVKKKVSGVSVSPLASTLVLGDGNMANNSVTLTTLVLPDDASDKSMTWSSSDTSIATVDSVGVVTAVKAGTVTITATSIDNSDINGTCDITVEQRVTQITSSTKYVSLNKGITCYLIDLLPYTILPSDATNKSVTFAISDSSIATVDNLSGTITAMNEGLAEITVTSAENPLYTYSWVINVSATASDHSTKSGKLEGTLLDSDGKPMVGYHVTLFSSPRTVITNNSGVFSFDNIPYSEHTLVINDPTFSSFIKYSINFNQTNRTNTEFDNTSNQITLNYSPNTSTFDITFQADSDLSSFDVLNLNFLDVLNTKYTEIVKNPETGYWS